MYNGGMNRTTHAGITMDWNWTKKPNGDYVIRGYVDGICRMEHCILRIQAEVRGPRLFERAVRARMESIAKEDATRAKYAK